MRKTFLKPAFFILLVISALAVTAQNIPLQTDPVRYLYPLFEKIDIQQDIEFGKVINSEGRFEKLLLDVYSPAGDVQTERPVILWIHGGGFRPGNDKTQSYIVKLATQFASKGYVCLSINYRVCKNPKDDKPGTMANALEDAMSGLNWIRKNSKRLNIDPGKIIVGGGSAGGMLAANLCYKDPSPGQKWNKKGIVGLVDLWGSPDESYSFYKIDQNDPPTIIVHGTADSLVSYINSEKLNKELEFNHVKHQLITIKGAGHTPTAQMEEFSKDISDFLYPLVSGKKGIGNFEKKSKIGKQKDESFIVPTSQRIEPAGTTVTFPGRPVDLALNSDESILAVKNLKDIVFFDVVNQRIKQTLTLKDGGNTFTGIGWSENGKKVWTTDTRGYLRSARLQENGLFEWCDQILLPDKIFPNGKFEWESEVLDKSVKSVNGKEYPGGFAFDEKRGYIYVALNRNNAIGFINLKDNKFEALVPVGIAPYTVIVNGDKAYVSNWGGRLAQKGDKTAQSAGTDVVVDPKTGIASSGTVSVIDLNSRKVINEIKVHLHPSGMVLHPDGSKLYVANANSDLISVINTQTDRVIKDLDPKPMADLPFGSAPNALAISGDGKTLYAANGGNNLIVVLDLTNDKIKGLIPTGWYPGAIVLNKASDQLFVANTKGIGTRYLSPKARGYKSNDHMGSISFVPVPSNKNLESYTISAASNMRLPEITNTMKLERVKEQFVPVPINPGEKSLIKHVLYIIKENKTYDQVFGGLKQGNGDSTLCQFGRNVTPNHHALAERFVLLDNTYCNGVLSADGHQWTDEGYVTDYLERSFGGFIRSYPYRGDDPLAFASTGFIWDQVLKKGLTFRNYGEFTDSETFPENVSWKEMYNDYVNNTNTITVKAKSALHTLTPYNCPTFPGFTGRIPDVWRAREFIKELKSYEQKGELPAFMLMLLPNDHTVGVNEGYPTPNAAVADNDLALGQIVEAVSNSKFWNETAIFVIQDDPQSGLDHVDGKRTVALCISPYTQKGAVVSTQYNQNSILRTIELILGLPPMSQFDLVAEPMTDCFTSQPDFTPYLAIPNQVPLDQMNPKVSSLRGKPLYWARKSMEMPLDEADEANDDELNRIVWFAVRGYDVPYPKMIRK